MNLSPTILLFDTPVCVVKIAALIDEGTSGTETSLLSPDQAAGYLVTALFTIVNIIVAYLVLKRFVFKPIIRLMEKRRTEVEEELKISEEKTTQANALLAESKKKLEDVRAEAAEILTEARQQAEKQAEMILSASKEEADNLIARSKEEASRMHNAMLENMKDEVADLAVSIASKVVGSIIDEPHQKEMREKILKESLKTEVKDLD
jgi:F-type H+-transporting ATPase subunit b